MFIYDFDGVDLDWEYFVVDDCSGCEEDFKNFFIFFKNFKQVFKLIGGRDEVLFIFLVFFCRFLMFYIFGYLCYCRFC